MKKYLMMIILMIFTLGCNQEKVVVQHYACDCTLFKELLMNSMKDTREKGKSVAIYNTYNYVKEKCAEASYDPLVLDYQSPEICVGQLPMGSDSTCAVGFYFPTIPYIK